jgi:hypothetical protein
MEVSMRLGCVCGGVEVVGFAALVALIVRILRRKAC